MAKMFIFYRLKPGVSREAFEAWVREKDYPLIRAARHVGDYRNHRVAGRLLSEDGPSYDYVEVFDADVDRFMADEVPTAALQAHLAEFLAFAESPEILKAEEIA